MTRALFLAGVLILALGVALLAGCESRPPQWRVLCLPAAKCWK